MIQTAKDIVADLVKFYEKKLSPAMVMFYEAALENYDEGLICRAVINLKNHEPPSRFPTIAVIQKYYFEEKDLLWQKQKSSGPRLADIETVPVKAEIYENFKIIFAGIGKMPKDQWLRLAVEYKMMTPTEAEKMKDSWRAMGADENKWRKDWFTW